MTPRDFGPPTFAPREHFATLRDSSWRVAFVFGSERFGLSNDDVYRCHACLSIPTHPDYGSLNLAQAVQLIAYDWREALGGFEVEPRTTDASPGARHRLRHQRQRGVYRIGVAGGQQEACRAPDVTSARREAPLILFMVVEFGWPQIGESG